MVITKILQLMAMVKQEKPILRGERRIRRMVLVIIPKKEAIILSLVLPIASKQLDKGASKYSKRQIGPNTFM